MAVGKPASTLAWNTIQKKHYSLTILKSTCCHITLLLKVICPGSSTSAIHELLVQPMMTMRMTSILLTVVMMMTMYNMSKRTTTMIMMMMMLIRMMKMSHRMWMIMMMMKMIIYTITVPTRQQKRSSSMTLHIHS